VKQLLIFQEAREPAKKRRSCCLQRTGDYACKYRGLASILDEQNKEQEENL
jgi:hypothetical protein